ncbi:hypothetical protein [Halorientalis marina]|uniref:hypothetical protein n=1 Tax=Halorientalis marina TaxID=2931976 RepID=UPI001FF506A6|nr:hypothetical protein [Halorientalis marina]
MLTKTRLDSPITIWGVLVLPYVVLRLPILLGPFPGWYRRLVQLITVQVAISTAQSGIPGLAPHHSFAGANLHGMLLGPVFGLGFGFTAVKIVLSVVGLASLILFGLVYRKLGMSMLAVAVVLGLVVVTPLYVLLFGYAMPTPVTMLFAAVSMIGYVNFYRTASNRWAVLSGIGAGLATLNHFWGGIVTVTLLSAEVAALAAAVHTGRSVEVRDRWPLWLSHFVGLIPAGILYVYYHYLMEGARSYGGYMITSSGGLLLQPVWYNRINELLTARVPYFTLSLLVLLVGGVYVVRYQKTGWLFQTSRGQVIPTTYALSLAWLGAGLFVLVLFPYGVYIHDYYLWWVGFPFAAVIGQMVQAADKDLSAGLQKLAQPAAILLVILTVSATMGPNMFLAQRANALQDEASFSNGLSEVVDEIGEPESHFAVQRGDVNIAAYTALARSGYVTKARVSDVENITATTSGTVAISDHRVNVTEWSLRRNFTKAGYTAYIYTRNTSSGVE